MTTLLSPRTPVSNLFLTGQNLNLHGVLGVSMTSFFTCAGIIGMDTAIQGL
jgi:all-trans-retinol 13,14-reductase